MNADDEKDRWFTLAQAVSRGDSVDWAHAEQQATDPAENDVVQALRALEGIARVHRSDGPATAVLSNPSSPLPPELARWRHLTIVERVGQGAFGTVYRAREEGLDREVALKLLRSAAGGAPADPVTVLEEARLLARVAHPNVVTIHGAESIDGRVGLWMEFIHGRTLEDLLALQGPFGAGEAAAIGIDLCHALAAVHGAGLLHRDIKCQNVMRAEGGRIVLMDFGAGAEVSPDAPGSRKGVAGTPVYLAPELFHSTDPSVATDIYSLGVLIYHLASGGYPVEGATKDDIARAHVRGERRRLRDVRPDLPDGFVRVVERALAGDPSKRYGSAGAFGDELAAALGFPQPVAQQARRSNLWVIAAGLALLTAAAGGRAWWSATASSDPISNIAGVTAGAQTADAASYEIGAKFHVVKASAGTELRAGDRLAPGDKLYLTVRTSKSIYLYVVNQDEQGESYLMFPLPGQSVTNPLPAGSVHRLPGTRAGAEFYWQVTSAGGREHFFVFASPYALNDFEQSVATLPRPTLDMPISLQLPKQVIGTLRGVGGLATAPAAATTGPHDFPFATPLLEAPEAAHGFWAREIVFENPEK